MDVYDTICAILAAKGDATVGRTAIQKLVYLSLQKMPGLDIPPYAPHYYGPFSPGVGHALEKLVSYSFVSEATIPGMLYGGYSYDLTRDGVEISENTKQEHVDEFGKIADIVKTCKTCCGLEAVSLSYASKIHHMLDTQEDDEDEMAFEDAVTNATKLGWQRTPGNVRQGADLLESLELVKTS